MPTGDYILRFDADVSAVNAAISSLGQTGNRVFSQLEDAQRRAVGSIPAAPSLVGTTDLPPGAEGFSRIPGSEGQGFGISSLALSQFRDLQNELASLGRFLPTSGTLFGREFVSPEGDIEVGQVPGGGPTRTRTGDLTPEIRTLLEQRVREIVGGEGALAGPRGGGLRGERLALATQQATTFLTDQILRQADVTARGTELEATSRRRRDQADTRLAEVRNEEIRQAERELAVTNALIGETDRVAGRQAVLNAEELEAPRRDLGLAEAVDRQQQEIFNARSPLLLETEAEVAQIRRDRRSREQIRALEDPLTQTIGDEVALRNASNSTRRSIQQLEDPLLTAQRRSLDLVRERDRLDRERVLIGDETISLERDANAILKEEDRLRRRRVVAQDEQVRAESEALAVTERLNKERDRAATLNDDNVKLLAQENANTAELQRLDRNRRTLLGLQNDTDSASVTEAQERLQAARSQRTIENAVNTERVRLASRERILTDSALEQQAISNARLNAARDVRIKAEADLARRLAEQAQAASSDRFLTRASARGGFLGGIAGAIDRGPGGGTLASFLGSGAASTLRFALPGAVLFGVTRGIAETVREAEELQQILVRLESQFEALGRRGVFGGTSPAEQTQLATESLERYRESLLEVSRDTGIAADQTAELGQRFIGLFSSIGDSTAIVELSESAARATSEFSVITGLPLEETFNDLVGGVRSFGETSEELEDLILRFTDLTVAVSDATGVASGEIADFVGRLGPAAAQAGLEFEELFALGATALQGSGVGGAALAEQFSRILTGLQGELGTELSRLSVQFSEVFAGIQLDDGRTVAELFNLQTIAAGEVDDVLIGLIQGFDSLSSAQQRQIIASVGSRREGAALAAVLQNAATFTNALDATTDATGGRQERFADIIGRLTGQLSRLRAELVQLGLDLLDAGLEDVLSGVLDALGLAVDGFQALLNVLLLVKEQFDFLPEGFGKTVTVLVALGVGLKGTIALVTFLTGSFAGLTASTQAAAAAKIGLTAQAAQAIAALNGVTQAGATSSVSLATLAGTTRGATAAFRTFLVTAAPLLAAFAGVALVVNSLNNANRRAQEAAENNAERISGLSDVLQSGGDNFDRAAQAAKRYATALSEVAEAESGISGPRTGPLGQSFDVGLSQIEDEDLAASTSALFTRLIGTGADLDALGEELVGYQGQIARIARLIDAIGPVSSRFRTNPINEIREIIEQENVDSQVLNDLIDGLEDGSIGTAEALELITVFYNTATAEVTRRLASGKEARLALQRAFRAADDDPGGLRVRERFDSPEDIAALTATEAVAEFLELLPDTEGNQQIVIESARQTFEFVRERFEAGLVGQREFLEVAQEEIDVLRQIVSANVRAGNTGDTAIEAAEQLQELEEFLASSLVDRFETNRSFLEVIGRPLEGQGLVDELIRLANSPEVQSSSDQLGDLAEEIIRAEQQIALDLIEGAESLEEKLAIRDAFGLSAAASRLVTLSQVQINEDVIEVVNALRIAEQQLPEFFDDLTNGVEEGLSLGELLVQEILAEIDRLSTELLIISPEARGGLSARIADLRALLGSVSGASVITGQDVGLEADLSEAQTQADIRIQAILDEAEQQQRIFDSLGQTDQSLAARITGLVNALGDPGLDTSSQDRTQLVIDLNDAINEALEGEGDKAQILIDAINQVVGNTDLTAQEFARLGLVEGLVGQNTNAFVNLVNSYISTNTSLGNSLLADSVAAANVYGEGVEAVRAIFRAQLEQLQSLLLDVVVNTNLFGIDGGLETFSRANEIFSAIQSLDSLINDPGLNSAVESLRAVGVAATNVGGGGGSAEDTISGILEAERALARALVGNNPEALAELELAIANEDLAAAENRVEELQALAQQIQARRSLDQVLNDIFNAENELTIAVLESQGDIAGALALGVETAEANLAFLEDSGAGAAQIAAAELALLNAQNAQTEGLLSAELDELGFLFNIGDLSTEAYIASLQGILDQLDPVADVDLWRQISLQIKGLQDSSNELQFNLPDSFDLPTLFEVRRLNQQDSIAGQSLQLGTSTTDNRQYGITINVQTGMDWEDARDILADALGADTNVFSLGTRRY